MVWYLSPAIEEPWTGTTHWYWPADGQVEIARNVALCFGPTVPDSGVLIGDGLLSSIEPTNVAKSAWQDLCGRRPRRRFLNEWLVESLTEGEQTLVPTSKRRLEVYLGNMKVHDEKYDLNHAFTNRLLGNLQRDFARLHSEDEEHARKVLGGWQRKYNTNEWKRFLPANLRNSHPGPLRPTTTITESFNTGDTATLGPDLTWTELGAWEVLSNAAVGSENGTGRWARADSSLSSDDHYSQAVCDFYTGSATRQVGVMCRLPNTGTTNTGYTGFYQPSGGTDTWMYRIVSGSYTQIASADRDPSLPHTYKLECDGSTIKFYETGTEVLSTTDTNITSNLRCGIYGLDSAGSRDPQCDSFQAGDLAADTAVRKHISFIC